MPIYIPTGAKYPSFVSPFQPKVCVPRVRLIDVAIVFIKFPSLSVINMSAVAGLVSSNLSFVFCLKLSNSGGSNLSDFTISGSGAEHAVSIRIMGNVLYIAVWSDLVVRRLLFSSMRLCFRFRSCLFL